VPIITPPVLTVSAGQLPPLSHDVLFLDGGSLKRWHGQTGQVETLLAPAPASAASPSGAVTHYLISPNGRIAALQRLGETPETFMLAVLDLESLSLTVVHTGTIEERGLLGLAFSPDGQSLAYIPEEPLAVGTRGDGASSGTVFVVRMDALDQPLKMGFCAEAHYEELDFGCQRRGRLLWAPGDAALVWNDAVGVWHAELGGEPRLLVPNQLPDDPRLFGAWAWSPDGDNLLAWIGYYEGVSQAVLDVRAGQVIPVPETFEYGEQAARANWLADGRLLVVRRLGSVGDLTHSLAAEMWRVSPADQALALDYTSPVAHAAPGNPTLTDVERLADGQLAFGILSFSPTDAQTRGLYVFAPDGAGLSKLAGLPPAADSWVELSWAPDGSGAFIRWPSDGSLLYAPSDGSAVYEIGSALGDKVCCLAWLK
jgi:hypothetical protein